MISASPPAIPSGKRWEDLRIRRALLRWFANERRSLPWREDRDPYPVWVSEIMLQQTQVATVIPYYRRFLAAFPTVRHLARAPLERVLKLWSGLGYYRRARHLHAAARMIARDFRGRFPSGLDQARTLPGVGRYTAGAVLSIAYNRPLIALDGNVARVVARLEARKGSLTDASFRGAIDRRLESLLSPRRPGDFNQALMELGQIICLPRSPRCPECPIRRWCRAREVRTPEAFPSPRPRRAAELHHLAAAFVSRRSRSARGLAEMACDPVVPTSGPAPAVAKPLPRLRSAALRSFRGAARNGNSTSRVLLVRGLDDGLMEDLWNFPSAFGASRAGALRRLETRLVGLVPGARLGGEMARVRHNITYRNIDVRLYQADGTVKETNNLRWLDVSRLDRAAVSELVRKIIRATRAEPAGNQELQAAASSRRRSSGGHLKHQTRGRLRRGSIGPSWS
jgi:A/G-specific adenine glycosylase